MKTDKLKRPAHSCSESAVHWIAEVLTLQAPLLECDELNNDSLAEGKHTNNKDDAGNDAHPYTDFISQQILQRDDYSSAKCCTDKDTYTAQGSVALATDERGFAGDECQFLKRGYSGGS